MEPRANILTIGVILTNIRFLEIHGLEVKFLYPALSVSEEARAFVTHGVEGSVIAVRSVSSTTPKIRKTVTFLIIRRAFVIYGKKDTATKRESVHSFIFPLNNNGKGRFSFGMLKVEVISCDYPSSKKYIYIKITSWRIYSYHELVFFDIYIQGYNLFFASLVKLPYKLNIFIGSERNKPYTN